MPGTMIHSATKTSATEHLRDVHKILFWASESHSRCKSHRLWVIAENKANFYIVIFIICLALQKNIFSTFLISNFLIVCLSLRILICILFKGSKYMYVTVKNGRSIMDPQEVDQFGEFDFRWLNIKAFHAAFPIWDRLSRSRYFSTILFETRLI